MIGLWCNGSTTGFGSVCPGSNPGSPTLKALKFFFQSFSFYILCAIYSPHSISDSFQLSTIQILQLHCVDSFTYSVEKLYNTFPVYLVKTH